MSSNQIILVRRIKSDVFHSVFHKKLYTQVYQVEIGSKTIGLNWICHFNARFGGKPE